MTQRPPNEDFFRQFSELWPGGYFEGDPRDPLGQSTYGICGFNSSLFTTYVACIRPYVGANTTALEIGPGRGAWSKCILERGAKHLYAVDAAPAEHTKFWQYVGRTNQATYVQARDFSLDGVPDNSIDYFFSFGVFCHLKPVMSAAYIRSLAKKMKSGANGFLQFGDFDKYNKCMQSAWRHPLFRLTRHPLLRLFSRGKWDIPKPISKQAETNLTNEEVPRGAWFHWSTQDACATINACGFEVVEPDIDVLWRDPVVHFRVAP
jgi:hypothetical protein